MSAAALLLANVTSAPPVLGEPFPLIVYGEGHGKLHLTIQRADGCYAVTDVRKEAGDGTRHRSSDWAFLWAEAWIADRQDAMRTYEDHLNGEKGNA